MHLLNWRKDPFKPALCCNRHAKEEWAVRSEFRADGRCGGGSAVRWPSGCYAFVEWAKRPFQTCPLLQPACERRVGCRNSVLAGAGVRFMLPLTRPYLVCCCRGFLCGIFRIPEDPAPDRQPEPG